MNLKLKARLHTLLGYYWATLYPNCYWNESRRHLLQTLYQQIRSAELVQLTDKLCLKKYIQFKTIGSWKFIKISSHYSAFSINAISLELRFTSISCLSIHLHRHVVENFGSLIWGRLIWKILKFLQMSLQHAGHQNEQWWNHKGEKRQACTDNERRRTPKITSRPKTVNSSYYLKHYGLT